MRTDSMNRTGMDGGNHGVFPQIRGGRCPRFDGRAGSAKPLMPQRRTSGAVAVLFTVCL
jgi:hypothetical protein